MTKTLITMIAGLSLSACMATGSPDTAAPSPTPMPPQDMACNAESVQNLLGQAVSAALGDQILKSTGARMLRWGPPRSAWTMDYRTDRVNISYDDAMVITGISCG